MIALGAIGLTLVYGILKLGNFAHGDYLRLVPTLPSSSSTACCHELASKAQDLALYVWIPGTDRSAPHGLVVALGAIALDR